MLLFSFLCVFLYINVLHGTFQDLLEIFGTFGYFFGTLFYFMVFCFTLWLFFFTFWYFNILNGTLWYLMVVYGSSLYLFVLCNTFFPHGLGENTHQEIPFVLENWFANNSVQASEVASAFPPNKYLVNSKTKASKYTPKPPLKIQVKKRRKNIRFGNQKFVLHSVHKQHSPKT